MSVSEMVNSFLETAACLHFTQKRLSVAEQFLLMQLPNIAANKNLFIVKIANKTTSFYRATPPPPLHH